MSLSVVLTHVYAWPEVVRGAERYLHELAGALADAGHRVRVLTTGPRPGEREVRGVPVTYLPRRRLAARRFGSHADEVAFGVQSLARLAGARFDVWHAMGTADGASAAVLGRVRNVTSVFTDHGFPVRTSRERRPDRRLHDAVVRWVDHYVCVSEAAAAYLRSDYQREAVVCPGGIDLEAFRPGPRRSGTPVLLFPADASEERKNLPLLLEAVAEMRRRGTAVELWMAGPGKQEPVVAAAPALAREAAVALGAVAPDGMADLYPRAWVTVLPARAEAFGLVLVESLACGTPVVSLDEGGPVEIVSPGVGVTARPDARSLADACEAAIHLAAQPDASERCRAAAARWDWRTSIVPRLEAVYGEAA